MLASAPPMDAQTLRDRAQDRSPEFLETLETMVNVDCGSYTPDGVNRIADLCEQRFRDHGWQVERRPDDAEGRGPDSPREPPNHGSWAEAYEAAAHRIELATYPWRRRPH